MALLGMFERDDYMPESGTLVVRDAAGGSGAGQRDVGPLAEHATAAQPCGTIARAGYGWLEAAAGDVCELVRLEHHDSAPPVGSAGWDDVVETPYGVVGGGVGLTYVTGGPASADLALDAGLYRVRVARAGGDGGDGRWLLQFWADADVDPPRWLSRQRPAVSGGITGWPELLGFEVSDLLAVVGAAGGEGVTFDQLTAWGIAHKRPTDWLDEPLFLAPVQPLVMGLAALSGFAAQLGVAEPSTRRRVLDLLVAAGVLVSDTSGRLRLAADPPRVWEVLELPAQRVEWLRRCDAARNYTSLASDIVSTVAWSRRDGAYGAARLTVSELAGRLLASPVEVEAALGYAVSKELLAVDGDTLTVLAGRATARPRGG